MATYHFFLEAAVGCFLIFFARCLWNYIHSPFKSLPGQWSTGYSNIWRFVLNYSRGMHNRHVELHRNHGDVVRMGPNIVSLADPALISTVFSTKKVWPKGEFYKPGDVIVNGMRVSNLFTERDESFHSIAIKPVRGLYSMTTSTSLEPHVDRKLELFTSTINERFEKGSKSVDMAEYLPFFAWDSMSQMTVGKSYGLIESGKDKDGILSTSKRGVDYFAVITQIPKLDLLLDKNPIKRIGPPPLLWATVFAYKVLAERKAESPSAAESRDKDFLDHFLDVSHEHPKLVDDEMVVSYLLSNILAGSDTTAIYMTAALYYILKTPGVYKKLKAELHEHNLPGGIVSWKATQQMPYFDAVMKEAARIHPGVGIMIEREVPAEGFTLPDGTYLPGGSSVGMNPWVVNRSEKYFGPDTDKFVPERWLRQADESEQAFAERRSRMKSAELTFGAGSRVCLGKSIAVFQSYKMTATLFNMYDIELENPDKEWTVHNAWFVYQSDVPCRLKPVA